MADEEEKSTVKYYRVFEVDGNEFSRFHNGRVCFSYDEKIENCFLVTGRNMTLHFPNGMTAWVPNPNFIEYISKEEYEKAKGSD